MPSVECLEGAGTESSEPRGKCRAPSATAALKPSKVPVGSSLSRLPASLARCDGDGRPDLRSPTAYRRPAARAAIRSWTSYYLLLTTYYLLLTTYLLLPEAEEEMKRQREEEEEAEQTWHSCWVCCDRCQKWRLLLGVRDIELPEVLLSST